MAKGLGKGIREFKGALSGITDEIEKAGNTPAEPKAEEKAEEKTEKKED
jgi:Sec-independent protein translocase protein TatA